MITAFIILASWTVLAAALIPSIGRRSATGRAEPTASQAPGAASAGTAAAPVFAVAGTRLVSVPAPAPSARHR